MRYHSQANHNLNSVFRFKLEKRSTLQDALRSRRSGLGRMSEIFSTAADFSKMAKNHEGLYVKEIHHKVTLTFSTFELVINVLVH